MIVDQAFSWRRGHIREGRLHLFYNVLHILHVGQRALRMGGNQYYVAGISTTSKGVRYLYSMRAEHLLLPPVLTALSPGMMRNQAFALRWPACKIFLRNRKAWGVASTSSSSRMNSRACSRLSSLGGARPSPPPPGGQRPFLL